MFSPDICQSMTLIHKSINVAVAHLRIAVSVCSCLLLINLMPWQTNRIRVMIFLII